MEEGINMRKGFTLVELLIVMAIIGVLASIGIGSFMTAQMRGRDAERKSDLRQTAHALELYYSDYGKYPDTIPWGLEFKDSKGTVYFKILPLDPYNDGIYTYTVPDSPLNQKFQLFAKLENPKDQDCLDNNCYQNPNFAITSANTNAAE